MLGRIAFFTTCATAFSGTAYIVGISLSPPPSYTVGNNQRIERYNILSHENTYEKKTRGQEFYLGISRWRRRLLRDEGLVCGRVLEVGAGCGGIISYYDALLQSQSTSHPKGINEEDKDNKLIQEIVLSDRSPGMVESASRQIYHRYGYWPYRYPDYDITGILDAVKKSRLSENIDNNKNIEIPLLEKENEEQQRITNIGGGIKKRKVIHGDGTIVEVSSTPIGDDESSSLIEGSVAPILKGTFPGNMLPLLNLEGQKELNRRDTEKK